MALTAEEKTQIINEFATHEGDTGSPEVQVALTLLSALRLFRQLPQAHRYQPLPCADREAWSASIIQDFRPSALWRSGVLHTLPTATR